MLTIDTYFDSSAQRLPQALSDGDTVCFYTRQRAVELGYPAISLLYGRKPVVFGRKPHSWSCRLSGLFSRRLRDAAVEHVAIQDTRSIQDRGARYDALFPSDIHFTPRSRANSNIWNGENNFIFSSSFVH